MRLRDDNLVMREIEGQTVLLDLLGSAYFASNRTGTFLLQLLKQEQERDALVAALVQEFGIETERAAEDADAFVALLTEQDLLV